MMTDMDQNQERLFRAGPESIEIENAPEHLLSDAVGRWDASPFASPDLVIRAACDALVAGLDSAALRELAGLPTDSRRDEVDALVSTMLSELGIPRTHELAQGRQIGPGGQVVTRPAADRLRLAVVSAPTDIGGFEVQVYVNDVEMTAAGAGMGMDPYDVLVPENRFVADTTAHRIPIARCDCGTYGCGVTDVSIVRDGDLVHWDWLVEVPMTRGVTFKAPEYDAEIARVWSDRSWETPDRTAGRLILAGADRAALARNKLAISWVANDFRDASRFCVCLAYADTHQVLLYTPWRRRSPQDLAGEVISRLFEQPRSWDAEWHSVRPGGSKPSIAGRRWRMHPMP